MKLLFNMPPQVLNVELAVVIGVNESLVLQQIHYWLEINTKANKNFRNGYYWTYNTFKEWQKNNFPYWSVRTVERIITNLVKNGLLITDNFNKKAYDRTKWYRLNYEKLKELEITYFKNKEENPTNPENTHYDNVAQSENARDVEEFNVPEENPTSPENTHYDNVALSTCQSGIMDYDNVSSPIPETSSDIFSIEYLKSSQVKSSLSDSDNLENYVNNVEIKKLELLKEIELLKNENLKLANNKNTFNNNEELTLLKEIENLKNENLKLKNHESNSTKRNDFNKEELKDKQDKYLELIKDNINYSSLNSLISKGLIDDTVKVMVHYLTEVQSETITISKNNYHLEAVKSRLLKIEQKHFEYACFRYMKFENKVNAKNKYILSCLFNSFDEMNLNETNSISTDFGAETHFKGDNGHDNY